MAILPWKYNHVTVIRIVDGDSVQLLFDFGMKISWKGTCRLSGINAPELRSTDAEEVKRAIKAKAALARLLPLKSRVTVDSKRLDKYGRPEALIINEKGVNVNKTMIANGNAKLYKIKL